MPSHSLSSRLHSVCTDWGDAIAFGGCGGWGGGGVRLKSAPSSHLSLTPSRRLSPISTSWHTETFLCSHEPQSRRRTRTRTHAVIQSCVALAVHRKFSGCCLRALTLRHGRERGRSSAEAFISGPTMQRVDATCKPVPLKTEKGNQAGFFF